MTDMLATILFNDDELYSDTEVIKSEKELKTKLHKLGVGFDRIGWDWYDCSLELYDVPPTHRLPEKVQKYMSDCGFVKVYVNHTDKWETHYKFWKKDESEKGYSFHPSEGWRVSYPHKRGKSEIGIWVEKVVAGWSRDWFKTGYVKIKKNK